MYDLPFGKDFGMVGWTAFIFCEDTMVVKMEIVRNQEQQKTGTVEQSHTRPTSVNGVTEPRNLQV